jgi:tetratricopeptide (TPR) repeat protein
VRYTGEAVDIAWNFLTAAVSFIVLFRVFRWVPGLSWRLAGVSSLLLAFAGGEAWATHLRNRLWSDPVAFWTDAVQKAPDIPSPFINLGQALMDAGRLAEAEGAFTKALSMPGDRKGIIHLNLATLAKRRGDAAEAKRQLLLALGLIKAKQDTSWHAEAFVLRGLGSFALQEGRRDEAEAVLRRRMRERACDRGSKA